MSWLTASKENSDMRVWEMSEEELKRLVHEEGAREDQARLDGLDDYDLLYLVSEERRRLMEDEKNEMED